MKKNSSKHKLTKKIATIFVGYIAGLIFCCVTTYAATYGGAIDVDYDNNNSGLVSTDVQGALDELYEEAMLLSSDFDTLTSNLDRFYRRGSIYISTNSTDPANLFGGEWSQYGQGRVLVGVDEADSAFNTVEKTGGNLNMEAHSHSVGNKNSNNSDNHSHSGKKGANVKESDGSKTTTITGIYNQGSSTISAIPSGGGHTHGVSTTTTNSISVTTGEAQNLMPYITVYIWVKDSD